ERHAAAHVGRVRVTAAHACPPARDDVDGRRFDLQRDAHRGDPGVEGERGRSTVLVSIFTSANSPFHRLIPCTPPPKPCVVSEPVIALKLASALILSKPNVPNARTDGLGCLRSGGTVRRACAGGAPPGGRPVLSGGGGGGDGGGGPV